MVATFYPICRLRRQQQDKTRLACQTLRASTIVGAAHGNGMIGTSIETRQAYYELYSHWPPRSRTVKRAYCTNVEEGHINVQESLVINVKAAWQLCLAFEDLQRGGAGREVAKRWTSAGDKPRLKNRGKSRFSCFHVTVVMSSCRPSTCGTVDGLSYRCLI